VKKDVAETICAMVVEVFDEFLALNQYTAANSSDLPIERIRLAIGACVTELDLEILEGIYQAFPDLRPAGIPELVVTCKK
jgi:hypothetical protein